MGRGEGSFRPSGLRRFLAKEANVSQKAVLTGVVATILGMYIYDKWVK